MSYKTLVTFVATETGLKPLLQSASALARRFDAHLEVCCMGVDTTQSMGFYAGAPAIIYQDSLNAAKATAETLQDTAKECLRGADIRWSTDSAVLSLGGITSYVGLKARFSDLVVLPLPYGAGRGPQDEVIIEAALFEGDTPVLVLPQTGGALPEFNKLVLAWNQSNEALHATRAALPLMKQADLVNTVIIDPPSHGAERSDPGGLLAQMLVRHGVQTDVSVLARTLPRTSDVLRRHLKDQAADLLVMGAYGRSRLREAILGGATRDMLEDTPCAVFLAH